jgi:hypothetical protein
MVDREKFISAYCEVMSIPKTPVAWWEAFTLEEKRDFAGKVYDAGRDNSAAGQARFVADLEKVCDHVVAGGE